MIRRFIIARLLPILTKHPFIVLGIGLIYIITPVDMIPEALTGFLGYFDDILALLFSVFIYQKLNQKKAKSNLSGAKPVVSDPYKILGVPRSASKDDITEAYRKKMALYHPDKVAHLGDELQQKAKEETLRIQSAYEQLINK